ncbi:hypothetical protein CRE_27784 [Caenorhabditis remanei]|uniref:Uncharacterized protein n=1 Tax=Caenorhabditis remanei TaxID=31234 RepID=E3MXR7_CAERE|nr:hypothetical protein CRE_27784 [Caenorhabditis remanei]
MKPFLFFLLSVFSISNACLVIQYSVPPACACKAQKLDSSNIFKNVQEGNIYFYNVTTSIIKESEQDDGFPLMFKLQPDRFLKTQLHFELQVRISRAETSQK